MRWLRSRTRQVAVGLAGAAVLAGALVPVTMAQAATARNLVPNSSVEQRSGSKPTSWLQIASGSNDRKFAHVRGGAKSGRYFVRTSITKRSSGYAGWSFAPVAVSPGATYAYADALRSNTSTTLRARMVSRTGAVSYRTFAAAPRTSSWKTAGVTFTLPKDTVKLSLERLLTSPGVLDVDTASLVLRRPASKPAPVPAPPNPAPAPVPAPTTPAPAPVPATGALVSITFDDGLLNQYNNARPVLAQNGFPATFYLISTALTWNGYMNVAQAKAMQSAGHELGSHSATHANLTQISADQLSAELAGSKATLEAQFGTIRSLAYPFGAHNSTVVAEATKIYQTARTTNGGVNMRGAINRGQLTMKYVTNTTDAATVTSWMNEAASSGGWTILVYHGVEEGGGVYSVTPAQFASHMAAVKNSGLRTATMSAAYDAMT